ncbi:cyclic nucleotide-binding domain-containing protein [Roseofilum casamattae]|uniref:Cache domain-containing protein n=1 Tax=Roseofilum casamattae BLCC-M143 TaxID=3022442 RepID=A0ABT7C3R3_9CYAN|nr:cache domain-containing protein [Roseofilum casamattae]MDJ1185449.1 cache domain-containing protein [Roseofilum casamattae BLCC-M143]
MINRLHIRHLLPILIVAPSIFVVGTIALIVFQKTRENINIVSVELSGTIADRVETHIRDYLVTPQLISASNIKRIESGTLDLTDLSQLEKHFWRDIQVFHNTKSIYFANALGELRGAELIDEGEFASFIAGESTNSTLKRYLVDENGEKTVELSSTDNYDPRSRDWYQAALNSKQAVWINIHRDFSSPHLTMTTAQVVRDAEGEVLGVFGVNLLFEQLDRFLQSLTIAKTGQTLIIDRQGQLIASSNPQLIEEASLGSVPLEITSSEQDLIAAIGQSLQNQFGSFSQVDESKTLFVAWKGKRYHLKIKLFRDRLGLDWLIVVAIPEQDFMQQVEIQARITLVLEVLILLAAIAVGLGVSRWVLQPIFQFSEAANQIKTGSFDPQTLENLTERNDEVGELARVFVKMAVDTGDRQQSLEEQLSLLNFRVSQSQDNPYELTPLKRWQKKATCIREVYNYQPHLPQLLTQVPWYENLSPEQLEEIANSGQIKKVRLGDYICREGEIGEEFYIVLTGSIRIFVEKLDKYLVDLSPGQCFGELALMLGETRTATAIALEPTILFTLDRVNFGRVLQQYPQMAEQIARDLHEHRQELHNRSHMVTGSPFWSRLSQAELLQHIQSRMKDFI